MAEDIREEQAKKEYEISFLVREEGGAEAVRILIVRHGGEIINASPMRRITLAYTIERETQAYFGFFRVAFPPAAVPLFTHDLQTANLTLRFLVVIPPRARTRKIEPREPVIEPQRPRQTVGALPLSNEALEKKIEEILQ